MLDEEATYHRMIQCYQTGQEDEAYLLAVQLASNNNLSEERLRDVDHILQWCWW